MRSRFELQIGLAGDDKSAGCEPKRPVEAALSKAAWLLKLIKSGENVPIVIVSHDVC